MRKFQKYGKSVPIPVPLHIIVLYFHFERIDWLSTFFLSIFIIWVNIFFLLLRNSNWNKWDGFQYSLFWLFVLSCNELFWLWPRLLLTFILIRFILYHFHNLVTMYLPPTLFLCFRWYNQNNFLVSHYSLSDVTISIFF